MSWDIYGEPLRRGHCEVHPHVHEEYPCSVCISDKRASEQRGESEHLLYLQQEHIEHLEQERDALAAHVERIISEWNSGDDLFSDEWINRMGDIVEGAPETSLARLKAQWQAEMLDELAMWILETCQCADPLDIERFRHERRQAEGGIR